MHSLDTTFDTLASTDNPSAIPVLRFAIESPITNIRERAVRALASRTEIECGEILLDLWPSLVERDLQGIGSHAGSILLAARESLRTRSQRIKHAIDAARKVGLSVLLPELIDIALEHSSDDVRHLALAATIHLADQLGTQARIGQDPWPTRRTAIERLTVALKQCPLDHQPSFLDALLLIASARDEHLASLLQSHSIHSGSVLDRLLYSQSPSIAELLVSFLRLPKIPEPIAVVLRDRDDELFRHTLQKQIGSTPSPIEVANLRSLGSLTCCSDTNKGLSNLATGEQRQHTALRQRMDAMPGAEALGQVNEPQESPARTFRHDQKQFRATATDSMAPANDASLLELANELIATCRKANTVPAPNVDEKRGSPLTSYHRSITSRSSGSETR